MMNRYRADQVGSLLRPASVLEARAAHQENRLDEDGLRRVEDEAILEALQMQRAIGIEVLSDGEFRRGSWLTSMAGARKPARHRSWARHYVRGDD
jgi:methionine synthase II (cobalamin-independent)